MKARIKYKIEFETNLVLNEVELRALDALVGYGFKPFIEVFYKHMGSHYLQPHESGLKSLFEKINDIRPLLAQVKEIKKAAEEANEKFSDS